MHSGVYLVSSSSCTCYILVSHYVLDISAIVFVCERVMCMYVFGCVCVCVCVCVCAGGGAGIFKTETGAQGKRSGVPGISLSHCTYVYDVYG